MLFLGQFGPCDSSNPNPSSSSSSTDENLQFMPGQSPNLKGQRDTVNPKT